MEVVKELQTLSSYGEVINDAMTEVYFVEMHGFFVQSAKKKIGGALAFAMMQSSADGVYFELNQLEVSALHYELEKAEFLKELQSIVIKEKVKLLNNGRQII
jgi:hypothetical protein